MTEQPSWCKDVFPYLVPTWVEAMSALHTTLLDQVQEIRLRSGKPIVLTIKGRGYILGQDHPILCTQQELDCLFLTACEYSPYARSEQIKQGYLTLRGGCRMGLSGRCVLESGEIKAIHPVTGLNLRILREVPGAANDALPRIRKAYGIANTLILSPPGGGKTTLLRDLVRQLSDGTDGHAPLRMGLIDERGEIAGCIMGVPHLNVGGQTDVMDGCSKPQGIYRLIYSMAPQVIAVDELGGQDDSAALEEAARCGTSIIATAHGSEIADLKRPILQNLVKQGLFEKVVLMPPIPGSGYSVLDLKQVMS